MKPPTGAGAKNFWIVSISVGVSPPEKQASASWTPLLVRGGYSQRALNGPISNKLRMLCRRVDRVVERVEELSPFLIGQSLQGALKVVW